LRSEKALAQERLDSYKYPVLTLPNEIISEIFVQFLPAYPLCPPSTGLPSPTLLTQICQRWREIALGTPMLWRAISLSFYDIPFHRQRHILDFLSRSGCCALSIQSDDGDLVAPVPEVFTAVVRHRARWEQLHLRISPRQLSTINGPMPLLRHLHLSFDSYLDPDESDPTTIVAFREVPLLRSVILDEYGPSNVTLPWAQLTSLTLNSVFRAEYLPILQQASNLRQCELGILFNYVDATDPHQITLPFLRSFTLDDANRDWNGMYPDVFVVPALRSLRIRESLLAPDPIHVLASFISTSDCKLQELCITGKRTVTRETCRKAFPWIHKFSFDDFFCDDGEGATDSNSSDVGSNSEE